MASSTSSSNANERITARPWGRLVLQAIVSAVLVVTVWEGFWRAYGYEPKLKDSYDRWAAAYKSLAGQGDNAVAFIGGSRLQQAIDMPTFRELNKNVVPAQLSISGCSPMPVLEYLAKNSDFHGTVIVDVTPRIFFSQGAENWPPVKDWILRLKQDDRQEALLSEPLFFKMERVLANFLQKHLISAGWDITPKILVSKLAKKQMPEPAFWRITEDRTQVLDYSSVDKASFAASRAKLCAECGVLSREQLHRQFLRLQEYVQTIQERGGRVFLVRTPSTGGVREVEQQRFPRQKFWDAVAKEVGAQAIHFEDYPQLSDYTCSDDAHVDNAETARYTAELSKLIFKGV